MAKKKPTETIDELKSNVQKLAEEEKLPSAFIIKRGSEWMDEAKSKPIPKKLFHEFWYEGELCFNFSDTNVGKSILSTQIGEFIASGQSEAEAQKVLYFDFELSDKQFERRYSQDYTNHYKFSENFYRVEVSLDSIQPDKFKTEAEWMDYSFNQALIETEAKIIIVDNIT